MDYEIVHKHHQLENGRYQIKFDLLWFEQDTNSFRRQQLSVPIEGLTAATREEAKRLSFELACEWLDRNSPPGEHWRLKKEPEFQGPGESIVGGVRAEPAWDEETWRMTAAAKALAGS